MNPQANPIVFNAAEVQPSTGVPEALPAGDYHLKLLSLESKPTNAAKKGEKAKDCYLAAVFEVVDGTGAGRRVFENFNWINDGKADSEPARIGRADFSALCHAVGVIDVRHESMLFGRPFLAKVIVEDKNDGYGAKNRIKKYSRGEGAYATAYMAPVQGGAAVVAGAAPAAGYVPPGAATPPPAAAPAPAARVLVVDHAKIAATGQTEATLRGAGWTDEHLVQQAFAVWQEPTPVAPPAAATLPAPVTPPVPAATVRTLVFNPAFTATGQEAAYRAGGWTDDHFVAAGHAAWQEVAVTPPAPAAVTPPPPAAPPAIPATPAPPAASAPVPPTATGTRPDGTPKLFPWQPGFNPALDS